MPVNGCGVREKGVLLNSVTGLTKARCHRLEEEENKTPEEKRAEEEVIKQRWALMVVDG